jgi:hypothetical protein
MALPAPFPARRQNATAAAAPYVVYAPTRPTTVLGHAAAILGDLALITMVLLVGAVVPTVLVWGVYLVAALIFDTWGRL